MVLGSVACDDGEGSGWGVVDDVVVEGDEMMCTARRCVVAGGWAAGLDPNVGGERRGDDGLGSGGSRRPTAKSVVCRSTGSSRCSRGAVPGPRRCQT